ncbi:MAG: hypothetical protein WC522_04815 [Candidatus Omnitrophota bacterium]
MKITLIKVTALFIIAASLAGCALFLADVPALWKIKEARIQVFDKEVADCYDLTINALAEWKAVVFQQRVDDYIVAMRFEDIFKSCVNTTEVGIFFTQTAPHKTEVKVTSLNYNLSQAVSLKLFDYIARDGKEPPKAEGQ